MPGIVIISTYRHINPAKIHKNNNALIYLTDIFLDMYPDAIFIALIRHPIALYESHKRRKTPVSTTPEKFYNYYNKMITKMSHDAKNNSNYHIIKFEDLISNPLESMEVLYQYSNLNFFRRNFNKRLTLSRQSVNIINLNIPKQEQSLDERPSFRASVFP